MGFLSRSPDRSFVIRPNFITEHRETPSKTGEVASSGSLPAKLLRHDRLLPRPRVVVYCPEAGRLFPELPILPCREEGRRVGFESGEWEADHRECVARIF